MKVRIGNYPKDSSKKRKISVEIDDYDIWNLDHTLALIIHPALIKLRESAHGAFSVDDEDVPDNIKKSNAPSVEEWETDDHYFDRWKYVLDEMIWAFGQKIDDKTEEPFFKAIFDKEGYRAWDKRMNKGFKLFGKYYRGLWT